jgi:O-antigen/teichoic acid export membrane protein
MRVPDPRSPVWVIGGAAISGAATYALLVLVGRAVGPAGYATFSLFWSAAVIASLGAFLPVEQVLATRTATGAWRGQQAFGRGVRIALPLVAVALVVHPAVWLLRDGGSLDAAAWAAVLLFVPTVAGFVWQFPARGVLAGGRRRRAYATVVLVDAGIRVVVAAGLWLSGTRSVAPYLAAVALSSVVCAVVGRAAARRGEDELPGTADPAPVDGPDTVVGPDAGLAPARRAAYGLVVAMLGMQALLNSGPVVAGLVATTPGDATRAGHLLAAVTLARLPVFVTQAAQALYVAPVAGMVHRGDGGRVRSLVRRLAALVLVAGALTVVVGVLAGPAVVPVLFGPEYQVTTGDVAVVTLGVAAYLVASVANDLAVALGRHRWTGPAWVAGVVAALAVALLVPDLAVRVTLPLLVGSAVAGAVLVPVVLLSSARLPRLPEGARP